MNIYKTISLLALAASLAACGAEGEEDLRPSQQSEAVTDDHGDEGEHGDEEGDTVELSAEDASALGIQLATAGRTVIGGETDLPAELSFAADKIATIAPRVGGVVRSLDATEGDLVEAGQVLAVLDSGRLATLMSDYHSARAAERYARATLERESGLRDQGITSESEFAQARQEATMAVARREAAETALHAAGIDHEAIETAQAGADGAAGRYRITAPIAGRVIERRLSLGQSVQAGEDGGSPAFVVADDSVVWADVQVYAADLGAVRSGQTVILKGESGAAIAEGEVAFVTPQLAEGSRTATARVVLDNPEGLLRPGQFVTASIATGTDGETLTVPKGAVVVFEGQDVVFTRSEHGFAPVPVETGRQVGDRLEIVSGLAAGDRFVTEGAFTLKAELEKDAFGDGHGH
ncbi:RND divalent metal cation efflux membrane fusion protein CzcB precursor [Parvularcula bermudensis HTCC2503]|uniref:RND divalent metal cation efflux membrane fusion protein CzcB n=1 Tax=Parvularcula bermudensis (strain ATCC BAA-594 / HTCC2503 / KCTC 12087) TaxID=314260 RepID=E0TIJ3_PARBH|nr:efflux RND transporter periplasmic adaptor subunit [Parvularcula bermudensis]ADM10851.1 RND divalent metal cation efflux membrane fusion protein CzcB precursor [Parvularcula bermudensis HTCC2503]